MGTFEMNTTILNWELIEKYYLNTPVFRLEKEGYQYVVYCDYQFVEYIPKKYNDKVKKYLILKELKK
jgi:hypothetical protein